MSKRGWLKDETHIASKASTPPRQMESDLNSLRVQVAELCGWKWFKLGKREDGTFVFLKVDERGLGQFWHDHGAVEFPRPENWREYDITGPPNYPSDLNACAAFEKMLPEEGLNGQQTRYSDALIEIVTADLPAGRRFVAFDLISATAEQRCRAFVRTMEASRLAADSGREPSQGNTPPGNPNPAPFGSPTEGER